MGVSTCLLEVTLLECVTVVHFSLQLVTMYTKSDDIISINNHLHKKWWHHYHQQPLTQKVMTSLASITTYTKNDDITSINKSSSCLHARLVCKWRECSNSVLPISFNEFNIYLFFKNRGGSYWRGGLLRMNMICTNFTPPSQPLHKSSGSTST